MKTAHPPQTSPPDLHQQPTHSPEFYLKEYECLRKEVEWLLAEGRSLERNVVVAVGITWAWLLDKWSTLPLPKWAWFTPCLFAGLGVLRAYGHTRQFRTLHEYLERLESELAAGTGPGGWEHFAKRGWTRKSTLFFWLSILLATAGVGVYEVISKK